MELFPECPRLRRMRCRAKRVLAGRTHWTAASRIREQAVRRTHEDRDFGRTQRRGALRYSKLRGEAIRLAKTSSNPPRVHRRWRTLHIFDPSDANADHTTRDRVHDEVRQWPGRRGE